MIRFPRFGRKAPPRASSLPLPMNAYRQSIYVSELDDPDHVFASTGPEDVEVLAFGRDFSVIDPVGDGYVLLTNGMSDRRMAVSPDADGDVAPRAELMWYVREPTDELVKSLRWLAKFPFIDQTWLGFGHRIPIPWPAVSGSDFKTFLLLTPIIEPDQRIAEALTIEGDPVTILTVNLISDNEYELIRNSGLDEFLDLLDEHDYPPIFDPERRSYL